MIILYKLEKGARRFTEIKKLIPNITDRMLTLHLKELEKGGLIERTVFASVPPKVIYTLSESGRALSPIWKNLERWGLEHKLRMESGKNTSISVPKQVSIP